MIINELKNYINDNSSKIVILKNKINVVNYNEIITINKKIISLKLDNKLINIKGDKLTLIKLLEEELLISGDFKTIEMENI